MKRKTAVTIGTFDGVHKGHRLLINKTLQLAREKGLRSVVICLDRPVKKVRGLLTTRDEKVEEIKALGVDEIIVIDTPSEFLNYSPDRFFDDILVGELNVSEIVCGSDFAFGKDRKGTLDWLKEKAENNSIGLNVLNCLKDSLKQISSSHIRSLIEKGEVEKAAEILGRYYSFSGIPFKDTGLGRKLGFPTVNLKVSSEKLLPDGVYISKIMQKNIIYISVTNIGCRLTFDRGPKIVPETHVLNFDGLWGKSLTEVILLKKIRDEKRFKSLEALKLQIGKDADKALEFFKLGKNNQNLLKSVCRD
ncbi:MAG: riboflavin biosynthesis protein RibF [Endomicrobium sp.]|jgi:riboflavin kinase/FMN adenylyltransferase|nr:riboflavin biosynthesis protein RibF [Endomicrobium sp.]